MKFGKTYTVTHDKVFNYVHDMRLWRNDEDWADNVDRERTKNNIIFKNQTLEETYNEIFKDVIDEYNTKQERNARKKRNDRKMSVKQYLKDIIKNQDRKNAVKPAYQILFEVGDVLDTGYKYAPEDAKEAEKILKEYYNGFVKRNKNLKIAWSGLHADEEKPHGFLTFVPIGFGYKKGLAIQVSLSRALAQQGFCDDTVKGADGKKYSGFDKWIASERAELKRICVEHGINAIEKNDPKRKKLTQQEYYSFMSALNSTAEEMTQEELHKVLEKPLQKLQKPEKGMFGYSSADVEALWNSYNQLGRRCLAAENLNARTGVNDAYLQQEQIEDLKKRLDKALAQADGFRDVIKSLRKDVNTLVEGLSARGVREVSNQLQNDGYGAKLAQKRVSQLDKLALRKATLKTKDIDENTKNFSRIK